MNQQVVAGESRVKNGFLDIATSVQRVLLMSLLLIQEWGSIYWSISIMAVYSTCVVVLVLLIVLYRICMNIEFSLNSIDFLVLTFFLVVFTAGVQSNRDYFSHRALFSWATIGASYCISRMSDSKQATTWLEILFCTTLCSRTFCFFGQFVLGTREPGIALGVCAFVCVCIGPWLVIRASSRWEKLFYIVGTLLLGFGLNVMFVNTIIVTVFVLFLLVEYVHFKNARRVIGIALTVAFIILVVANLDYGFIVNRAYRVRLFWGNGPGVYMSLQDPFVSNGNMKTLTDSIHEVIFYEFGVLGLCVFSIVCFIVFLHCVLQEDLGIAVAIFALSIYLLNVPYSDTSLIVLWTFLGIGSAHSIGIDESRVSENGRPFFVKSIIIVLTVIFVFQYVACQIADVQAQGHILLGERLRKAGLFSQALENYRKAVVLAYENPAAHVLLGNTFLAMDMYREAALLFERALEYGSRSRSAYVGLAESYLRLDKRSLALRILQEGSEFHPDINSEAVLKHVGEQSTNNLTTGVQLSEIGHVEYENGVIGFEILIENQGNSLVDMALSAQVLGFEEKMFCSIGLDNMIIKAGSSRVLQKSISVFLPKGIYVLKIFTRYGDETDEIIRYFVVSS